MSRPGPSRHFAALQWHVGYRSIADMPRTRRRKVVWREFLGRSMTEIVAIVFTRRTARPPHTHRKSPRGGSSVVPCSKRHSGRHFVARDLLNKIIRINGEPGWYRTNDLLIKSPKVLWT